MVKTARWCLNNHPNSKSVIYNPKHTNRFNFDKKPFKCLRCGREHSYKELGLVRGKPSKKYTPENPDRVNKLAKLLRKHCIDTRKKDETPL